jgi:hypothetical protein
MEHTKKSLSFIQIHLSYKLLNILANYLVVADTDLEFLYNNLHTVSSLVVTPEGIPNPPLYTIMSHFCRPPTLTI